MDIDFIKKEKTDDETEGCFAITGIVESSNDEGITIKKEFKHDDYDIGSPSHVSMNRADPVEL